MSNEMWASGSNPPPSSQPGWQPPVQSSPPPRRKRGKVALIIGAFVLGSMLLFGACAVLLASLGEPDTATRAEPVPTKTSQSKGPATTAPVVVEDEPSDVGRIGTSAIVIQQFPEAEGEILLEKMERSGGKLHFRLHVKSNDGAFTVNPNDFYLRKADDTRVTYDWFGRTPILDLAELRKGKAIRAWLSFKSSKGTALVYAPGLGDQLFEWKIS